MAFVYDNKEYRNLQQQVFKNMNDISFILQEEGVLNEFGIKVVGQEANVVDMPTVDDYKEDNPEWAYGDAYAIGTEAPYELYVLTRANGSHPNDYWFNIGEFPAPGPEGPEGPQGEQGVQGQTGPSGQDGITPVIVMLSPSVTTLSAGSDATATVTIGGTIAAPTYKFDFGIPRGEDGSTPTAIPWGSITGSLANQTDLVSALQGKANASALLSYATQVYANNVANNAEYQAVSTIRTSANEFAGSMSFASDVVFNSYIYKGQSNYIDYPIELPYGSGTLALQSDIPSLSGYATEAWVSANFLSADTPIGGAAQWGSISGTLSDQTDLMSKFSEYALLSDIPSLSGYATEAWVVSQNYASQTWVNNQISGIDYASVGALSSSTQIPSDTSDLTNNAGYITSAALSSYATVSQLSDYATVSAMSSAIGALDYASVGALSSGTVIPTISGTNDGTNWTSITIDEDTYDIPSGGGSGDYVPILVEDSEEDPEMPQYRYAGEISNSSSAIVETVIKEEPDQVAANKTTSLELYQDDAYLSHSYQELVSKDNPDYDPEDPESSPTIEEAVDLSTNLYVGEGTITANRSLYDEGLQEVVNEEVDLFDLATQDWVSENFLSSGYTPSISVSSPITYAGGVIGLSSNLNSMNIISFYSDAGYISGTNSGFFRISATSRLNINANASGMAGASVIRFGLYSGNSSYGYVYIPTVSGTHTVALLDDIPSVSEYATVSALSSAISGVETTIGSLDYASVGALSSETVIPDLTGYATESWVSSNFLSSGYVPVVSGYAELSASNIFTGNNTFSGASVTLFGGAKLYIPYATGLYATKNALSYQLSLPDKSGTVALISDIDALSSVYQPIGSYLSADDLSGYAQLSVANTFTANQTFSTINTRNIIPNTVSATIGGSMNQYYLSAYISDIYANSINVSSVSYASEVWTFTLSDNTSVSKTILVG